MKTYKGIRTDRDGALVFVFKDEKDTRGRELPEHRDHSATGFEWGYSGAGPAQLAYALLIDVYGRGHEVVSLYHEIKFEIVARFPQAGFTITEAEIRAAVDRLVTEAKR